ncbi:MAG: GNAT family N-acetyltransferase [Candidatus Hodarchaeota archaeon]
MIFEVPHDRLMTYLPLFKDHPHYQYLKVRYHSSKGFVDDLENPKNMLLFLDEDEGEYFLAGNRKSATIKELLERIPARKAIYAPNRDWVPVLREQWDSLVENTRFIFSSNRLSLSAIQKLKKGLPIGFIVEKMTLAAAHQISFFQTYPGGAEAFIQEGIGFLVKKSDAIVSWAWTSPAYNYEIGVITEPGYQQKGLATVICAHLIEHCLKHGIRPRWDAENEISAHLALKLGFTNPQPNKYYFWE